MAVQTAENPAAARPQNGHGLEMAPLQTADPLTAILANFRAIPAQYHADLFRDFQDAATAHDLRRLLETVSDWAATAELYASPELAADLTEAIGDRKGAADWLTG